MKKRLLSIVTTFALCLTLLPATALAEESASDPSHVHTFELGIYDRSDDTYHYPLCDGYGCNYVDKSTPSEHVEGEKVNHMCDVCGKLLLDLCYSEDADCTCDLELCRHTIHSYEYGYYYTNNTYHYPQCDYCDRYDRSKEDAHKEGEVINHICDTCGYALINLCKDENGDHVCDNQSCRIVLDWMCEDRNPVDHLCDNTKCAHRISTCTDITGNDNICDICNEGMYPRAAALNVKAVPGDGKIIVTWDALEAVGIDTVASYTVYCGLENDIKNRQEQVYSAGENTHTFTGLTAGITYEVGVCATYTEHEEDSSPFEVEQSILAAFYDLWVGGVQVTSANNDDVLDNDTVSFSADENILTLDGANITAGYKHDDGAVAAIYTSGDLTIELVGTENRITAPDAQSTSGIWAGALTISGKEGSSLTVSGGSAAASGANAESVGISVSGGINVYQVNVTAVGGSSTVTGEGKAYSNGIYTEGDVMVDFGGQLIGRGGEASGTNAYSSGMDAYGEEDAYLNVAVYDDSILELTGGTATASVGYAGSNGLYGPWAGLYVYGINSHTVLEGGEAQTAGKTTDAYACSNGILIAGGDVGVENGTVVITSGQWSGLYGDGYALYVAADEQQTENGVIYSGGSVNFSCEEGRQGANPTSPFGTRVTITSETGPAIYAEIRLAVDETLTISTPEGASVQGIGGCNDPENWVDPEYWTIVDVAGAKAQSFSVVPLLYIVRVNGLDSSAQIRIPAGQTVNQVVNDLYASAGVTDFLEVLNRMNPDAQWSNFGGWYTDEACTTGNEYPGFDTPVNESVTIYPTWIKKSSGGGGGSSNTTTKTEKNEDGSTTTITTNKATGTVTETTKTSDGTIGTMVTDKKGNITEISAKVPASAAKDAEKSGEAVKLPIEVEATENTEDAQEIKIDIPSGGAKMEIPVEDVTPGTVVVIVNKDGTEEIVKTCTMTENGVVVTLEKDATIKVIGNSKDFDDVTDSFWAGDSIDFVTAREIFGGISATTFSPNGTMTRQAMWMVLARMSGEDPTDMAEAKAWAVENGISDGSAPTNAVTRQQFVTMLWRWHGEPESDHSVDHHVDAHTISSYAEEAVAWAVEHGIKGGYPDGTLRPHGTATRAHVATFIQRFYEYVVQ